MPDITTASTANHSIRFGCSYDWPGCWPWAVAQEKHLFEANSAHVELQWFDDYYEALDALAQGALDANCQVFNDTLVMVDQAIDGEVVVLVTDYSDGNDKVIVTDQIKIPTQLAGRRVGVEKGKLTEFLLTLALEKAGISRDDIDIRYANTTVGAIAFVAGALDGIVAWQPDWLMALRRSGSHELLSSRGFPGAIPQVVVVTQKMIVEQEDEVQALINTWFDTLAFIRLHPDESAAIMLRCSTLSDINYQRFMQGVHLLSPSENIAAFSPGETLEHLSFTAQKAADFLVDVEEISRLPHLTELLKDEFVKRYEVPV
ncbi:MAG: ABC transporter substrate-binding protein [Cyanobacteria bacterium J06649_4]